MKPLRCYFAEFLGTFTLVFMGTAVAVLSHQTFGDWGPSRWLGISFAFGGTLAVLVWVIGPLSGCHVNPAVSLAMSVSGRLSWDKLPGYLIAQFAGATAASAVLFCLMSGSPAYQLAEHGLGANGNPKNFHIAALVGWEALLTALFLFAIFTATRKDAPAGGWHGLAIGGFLFLAHMVGAQLGDSSVNPARSFGPAIIERGAALQILWVFIVGPVIGGLAGWLVYQGLYDEDN